MNKPKDGQTIQLIGYHELAMLLKMGMESIHGIDMDELVLDRDNQWRYRHAILAIESIGGTKDTNEYIAEVSDGVDGETYLIMIDLFSETFSDADNTTRLPFPKYTTILEIKNSEEEEHEEYVRCPACAGSTSENCTVCNGDAVITKEEYEDIIDIAHATSNAHNQADSPTRLYCGVTNRRAVYEPCSITGEKTCSQCGMGADDVDFVAEHIIE